MSGSVILFADPRFPGGEALEAALPALAGIGKVVGAAELAETLEGAEGGSFVNLHAPYFPKSAWPAILDYLSRGGGLVSVGGAPFKRPVRLEDGQWTAEAEQTAYHQQLHVHETLRVKGDRVDRYRASENIPLLVGQEALLPVSDTWNLVPHVTKSSDLPHQMGSSGPMDTRVYPLVKGISAEGREVSAPVVLWEHIGGPFAGGRWLFVGQPFAVDFWTRGGAEQLAKWASFAGKGVTELWLKPGYATYESGERAQLTLQTQRLGRSRASSATETWSFSLSVRREGDASASALWTKEWREQVTGELNLIRIPVPLELEAGLYRIECRAVGPDGEIRVLKQGFWGMDAALLKQGTPISAGRDFFIKDGRPFPVVGMTYMTSDVARKFLFLPNADVWDRDMAQMKKAGINWIRTGIWTAYRNIMQVDGHASEEVLRAIDAFVLTAKRHDLQLTFTFFSFTPEPWEGLNPYLDPRSVEAQKRFIRSIVSRHRQTANIDWDLINEPSMFDPAQIFSEGPRSCRDPFEQAAFSEWLAKRHGSIELLQERWNMSPAQLPDFASAKPPEAEEINFSVQDIHSGKKGTRWLDYVLFSMEMHNRWAKQLRDTIKELCPDHLVTVGQDEALGAQRPSPFFYEEAVDYTTVHSWWFNDYLLWDGIFAKTANKPNLIQETGIMYVETPDGRAKRSEEELRALLERKYAYAYATGGAGAVQWIWNTNFYMDNANESQIGALRADGTEKPEADVSYDFGRFMGEIGGMLGDRKLEDIAVVFPYSNDFSNRKLAFDATTKLTRALAYELNLPFRAVSEYHLGDLEAQPAKLIILPSAHNVDDEALRQLIATAERTGAVLLVTGALRLDAYWHETERLAPLVGKTELRNVQREELLQLAGEALPVSFGHRRIAEAVKEVRLGAVSADGGFGTSVADIPLGKGRLIWCPLPIELNERIEPLAKLYRHAAEAAGACSGLEWLAGGGLSGVYGRKLSYEDGFLYIFVSEFAWDADVAVKDNETGTTYSFVVEKERSVLFAADRTGRVTSVYRPNEVAITADKNEA
ncbi:beta-galactosidase [Paenibacillus arenilitoris]|uniref:Beta-galactosidase n=1 Tax=Paenibacillus arenilitoris TaxID=2772299 RepID=A0A927H7Q1_9BACL|nr:beta-galactosidase [Paenibacillus arenilitoris]MBD2870888.1 beta-galactosidase [Paenibacillus arenilitoris]